MWYGPILTRNRRMTITGTQDISFVDRENSQGTKGGGESLRCDWKTGLQASLMAQVLGGDLIDLGGAKLALM